MHSTVIFTVQSSEQANQWQRMAMWKFEAVWSIWHLLVGVPKFLQAFTISDAFGRSLQEHRVGHGRTPSRVAGPSCTCTFKKCVGTAQFWNAQVHPSAHLSSGQSHSWNSSDRKWLLSQFCTRVHLSVLWIHAKTYTPIIYIDLQISICQYLSSMVSSVTLIVASSFHRYHRCHLTWSICPDAEAMKSALVFRSHFFWAPRRTSSLDIWLVWHFRLIVLVMAMVFHS